MSAITTSIMAILLAILHWHFGQQQIAVFASVAIEAMERMCKIKIPTQVTLNRLLKLFNLTLDIQMLRARST